MKTLAQYLAEYLNQEINDYESCEYKNPQDRYFGETELREWIEQGIDAYESTENCSIGIVGGDCPDCNNNIPMECGTAMLYNGRDEIEVVKYECPECGYEVYS